MVELAERLLTRTLDNQIRWIDTDRDDQYLYPASTSGVTIERGEDRFDGPIYQLTLLNADGKAVQELSSETFQNTNQEFEAAPWNLVLERLFDAARREALGIDSLLDKTLKDIDEGVSKTETAGRLGGKKKASADFDDPWATAKPVKPASNFDDEPPF
ncbi:MAG TPA: hypothetical protein VF657_10520 [Actinoplanes sp.]|jgi:hypothetical protein